MRTLEAKHAVHGKLSHMSDGGPPSEPGMRTHTLCVLWHAPMGDVPAELRANLAAKRDVNIVACTSAYRAIAQVLNQERENDLRDTDPIGETPSASGDGSSGPALPNPPATKIPIVFLLIRPDTLENPADVVSAVRRFAPRCACWMYDPRSNPALRSVTESDIRGWAEAASSPGAVIAAASASAIVLPGAQAHVSSRILA